MPKRCALGCPPLGVSTHVFPHPEKFPETFKAWVEIAGGKLETPEDYSLYSRKKICDIHFPDGDRSRNHRLNAFAVPTLFLPGEDRVTLHSFPNHNKEPSRFRDWIYAVKGDILALDNAFICKRRKVCHKHFETKYHTWTKTLSPNAVPTLYLPGSQPIVPIENSKSIENVSVQEPTSKHEDSVVDTEEPTSRYEDIAVDTIEVEEPADVSVEDAVEGPFSWQQSNAVVPCDADLLDQEEGTPFFADDQSEAVKEEARQTDTRVYHCNECEQEILWYRYICVQCSDYELCSTCEGKGLHFLHYVLRVPACKTQVEVEALLDAVRRAINSLHLNHDQELEIKEETEVLLHEENLEPSLYRDPFADDTSVAESGTVPLDSQILAEDYDSVHSDPMHFESGPVFASPNTVLEDFDPIPQESYFEKKLDRRNDRETGDKNPKKEILTETSLHNTEILQCDQATEKCDLNICQNKNVNTSNKIVLKVVPKSFLLQRNVSAQNNKVLLKVVTMKPKGNVIATEGTTRTTESSVLPAKNTVLVTGKTMPARGNTIPFTLKTSQTSVKTLPTVVRSIPTLERNITTVVRSSPTSESTLPIVVRSIPTSERNVQSLVRSIATSESTLPAVVRSIPTSERTLPTVVRSVPTSERTLPTVLTARRIERTFPSTERLTAGSQNQKIFHLSIETGTTTITKPLKVSMSNLEHNDADALSEPLRKKFKIFTYIL